MGRKLSNLSEPTPVISIKGKEGSYFEGVLLTEGREVPLKRGKGVVFNFTLMDTDMGVSLKGESGKYEEITVDQGAEVSIFAPTVLQKMLKNAKVGEKIRIVYLGKAVGKDSGVEYHNFDSEVMD